jgi:hypothetical protein
VQAIGRRDGNVNSPVSWESGDTQSCVTSSINSPSCTFILEITPLCRHDAKAQRLVSTDRERPGTRLSGLPLWVLIFSWEWGCRGAPDVPFSRGQDRPAYDEQHMEWSGRKGGGAAKQDDTVAILRLSSGVLILVSSPRELPLCCSGHGG